jgi:hypothetical protein
MREKEKKNKLRLMELGVGREKICGLKLTRKSEHTHIHKNNK